MTVTADRPTKRGASDTGALVVAVEVVASFVASFEPGRYDPEDAARLVATFTRAERLCGAGKTLAAARVAESPRHLRSGHRSAAEWLAAETGDSVGGAVDVLQLGQTLVAQPEVDQAYRDGKLSSGRAKLVSDAARVNPTREHDLVAGSEHDTLGQLKQRCLRARAEGRSAEETAEAQAAIHRARRCRTWTDAEGAFRLDALLTPEAGARLLATLTPTSRRFFEQARSSGVHEPTPAYAADALVALVTGDGVPGPRTRSGSGTGSGSGSETGSGSGQGPTVPGSGTDHTTGTDRRGSRAPSTSVLLRVDLDALRRGSVADGEICELPGVGPVSIQRAREMMGDSLAHLVITDGVDVTTICRLGRTIPAILRTALLERDQLCVVPGCDVRQGLEFDHWQVDYSQGGRVSLENIARLCRHHHRLRTSQGFLLSGGPGRWRWDPPKTPKRPQRPKRPRPKKPTRGTDRGTTGATTRGTDRRRPPPGG